jgi:ferrochelatase
MAQAGRCDAVLIVGFGGPTRPEEIRPFLDNVLRGRPVPRERYEEVVHHYEALGGRSPYNEITLQQAAALRDLLARDGITAPVEVGMRNWEPYVVDALVALGRAGARRVLGFILAAHRSEASWERYQAVVRAAREAIGPRAPEVEYPEPWHTHPRFIAATAARVAEAIARLPQEDRGRARLIFTAHSIPVAMAAESPYVDQLTESCRLVAKQLGIARWTLAFQSRSGSPRDRWLEPDIGAELQKIGEGGAAVVAPIGFLCDHVEVLYDLDIDAARIAGESGVRMERAATVGAHPEFIAMIAEVARAHLNSTAL